MRPCELKRMYDPNLDKYVRKNIYGEGIFETVKSIGKKLLGKTTKKALSTAVSKTGEYAGDKKKGEKEKKKKRKKKKRETKLLIF